MESEKNTSIWLIGGASFSEMQISTAKSLNYHDRLTTRHSTAQKGHVYIIPAFPLSFLRKVDCMKRMFLT